MIRSADLEMVCRQFTGEIVQVPPVYSAIKKKGQRSYDLARQGKAVALDGRKVTIRVFEMEIAEIATCVISGWFVQQAPIYAVWPMMWVRPWDAGLILVHFAAPELGITGWKMPSNRKQPK